MPDFESHERAAIRNQKVLDCLLEKHEAAPDDFSHWVIIVSFYKALHMVEAIFYADGIRAKRPVHSKDHTERNQRLKNTKKYENIWRYYRPLYEASLVARYLFVPDSGTEQTDLDTYLSGDSVRSKFINHYLRQIEKTFDAKKEEYEKSST